MNIILGSKEHMLSCLEFFKLGYNQCNPSEIPLKNTDSVINIFLANYAIKHPESGQYEIVPE